MKIFFTIAVKRKPPQKIHVKKGEDSKTQKNWHRFEAFQIHTMV